MGARTAGWGAALAAGAGGKLLLDEVRAWGTEARHYDDCCLSDWGSVMAGETGAPDRAASGISQFLVQAHGEERDALLDYAVEHGYGVDVADFIFPRLLDDGLRCAELVAWYRSRLPDVPGLVTFHGALWDLLPSARDSKVRAATMERMRQCLDIAEELGIDSVTFHLDFLPPARDPNYVGQWTERQAFFWRELLHGRSVAVLLENTWEPRPEIVGAAVDAVGMDCVGACLDAPHVHRSSRHSQSEWVNELGGRIRCLHVSDNDGTFSQHLPPGQGTIDWRDVLGALVRQGLSVPAVIEVPGVEGARESIEYLASVEVGP
jgi:sugar phosphate isomerase/epimerase